jgi:N-acylneuraminate cytidylyltransferase
MNVAIITARGGSKRIPRKNLREFCGRPILSYSIDAAKNARCFDEVMVSTDDAEIAAFAVAQGAAVPFMRSAEASSDGAATATVISEVLAAYADRGRTFDYVCCLYPTAPFVTSEILERAFAILRADPAMSGLVPIVRFSFPPQRAFCLDGNRVRWSEPEYRLTRSQDLEPVYHDAGQFYWLRVSEFAVRNELITDETGALVLADWQVQDIDNEDDWILAEVKYRYIQSRRA